jgi:hypothetical protein
VEGAGTAESVARGGQGIGGTAGRLARRTLVSALVVASIEDLHGRCVDGRFASQRRW